MNKMWSKKEYDSLDKGIRFPVKVLHAAGLETCQSCEGGKGHAYEYPTIEMIAAGNDVNGFTALAVLAEYGIEVGQISIVWPVQHFMPYEKNWRIELNRKCPERSDEWPIFVADIKSYQRAL